MGNRDVRRLLDIGAMGVISARRRRDVGNVWRWQLIARKPL
jgi:transposase